MSIILKDDYVKIDVCNHTLPGWVTNQKMSLDYEVFCVLIRKGNYIKINLEGFEDKWWHDKYFEKLTTNERDCEYCDETRGHVRLLNVRIMELEERVEELEYEVDEVTEELRDYV